MKKEICKFSGCNEQLKFVDTFKGLDNKKNLFTVTVPLCEKHYKRLHELKELEPETFINYLKPPLIKSYL
jgi:hypothetical protein